MFSEPTTIPRELLPWVLLGPHQTKVKTCELVVPSGANWHVKIASNGRVLAVHADKAAALAWALAHAKAHEPAQVIVQTEDGRAEYDWSYGQEPVTVVRIERRIQSR